jgi:hypothetical protein
VSGRTTEIHPGVPVSAAAAALLVSITDLLPATTHRRASVVVSSLVESLSIRNQGVNEEHVATLLDTKDPLPPIVVHAPTSTVIDGVHRVCAARRRDDHSIEAYLVDCPVEDAILLAVKLNTCHGLPLTRGDRRAGAAQILRLHPEWSDRRIAGIAGLSPKTVASVRREASEEIPQSKARIGRDGRNRSIAAGSTRRASRLSATGRTKAGLSADGAEGTLSVTSQRSLRSLSDDPSVRGVQSTRLLLQIFSAVQMLVAGDQDHILDAVPAHRQHRVAAVARECALSLTQLATALEGRL